MNIDLNVSSRSNIEIYIQKDSWSTFLDFCGKHYSSRKIFVIIDENVFNYHGKEVEEQCRSYFTDCHVIKVPAGEQSKSVNFWEQLVGELLQNRVERSTPILAVGGGVTGDLAGFVAASTLRGVPLIHMPTSLLAMVDSSIGGKTGVNHTAGKNLIGAFYQPDAVFCHMPFLKTLPDCEWVNGLAEMLKYAAINKPILFEELQNAVNSGFTPNDKWEQLIHECAKIKCEVVEADTFESGQRAFLNFGHTFAHAFENVSNYKSISHGEAVFAGMFAAVFLSQKYKASVNVARFRPFKTLYHINLPDINKMDDLIEAMYSDKKVKDGNLHFILLADWGKPFVERISDRNLVKEACRFVYSELQAE